MITIERLTEIKKLTQDFFEKMGFEVEFEILSPDDKTIPLRLKTEDPEILIGQNGQTLAEIQHLLKIMFRREISDEFYIDLDINDYKKKKIEYLKETAVSFADEVVLSKKERMLTPMSAYERRIIHLELAEKENVTTESIGEEPERRVVIRPHS